MRLLISFVLGFVIIQAFFFFKQQINIVIRDQLIGEMLLIQSAICLCFTVLDR